MVSLNLHLLKHNLHLKILLILYFLFLVYDLVHQKEQFFDSCTSFGIIRGGHVDVTVLGALQVDKEGNLANWMVPGKMVPGMGGAMDLVVGAKHVIVAMEHTSNGAVKILKECKLPLTAVGVVDLIITEKAVFEVTDKGLVLKEITPYSSLEDIKATTAADFIVADNLKK